MFTAVGYLQIFSNVTTRDHTLAMNSGNNCNKVVEKKGKCDWLYIIEQTSTKGFNTQETGKIHFESY